jgi:galactose mutarotase-like enzyme
MPRVAAAVEETTRDGYSALTLRAGDLSATFVPQLGMIGASLEHRGQELLGQRKGLAAYEATGSTMGIPLLHPWANRLSALTYEAAGLKATIDPDSPRIRLDPNGLPIHGLLAANPHWQVGEQPDGLRATLDFSAQPELLEAFPFEHELAHHIALTDDTLTIATTLTATGDHPVPVSFGFHPYFALPDTDRADWHVEIPVTTRLEPDDEGIPTGATQPADVSPGPLGDRTFDDLYEGIEDRPFVLQGGGRRVEVAFREGYPYAQVFAPPGQDLICFEPMTAPTDALASGTGLRTVEPGQSFTAAFDVRVTTT